MEMTEQASIDAASQLGEGFKGEVIPPGDPGYDDARAVWNGSIDKRPTLIVRPRGAADVIDAVNYAREKGLPSRFAAAATASPATAPSTVASWSTSPA
jgi:hypothetical protein